MRIAIPYDNGQIFTYFGHADQFKFYDVENGKIVNEKILDTPEKGHAAVVAFLSENNVNVVFCDKIGENALKALTKAGIRYFYGESGSADFTAKMAADFMPGDEYEPCPFGMDGS